MKITDLKPTIVSVPYKEEEVISYGARLGVTNCLLEVETDEGISGIGECMSLPNAEIMELALRQFQPLLVGQDPFNVEAIAKLFYYGARWAYVRDVGNSVLAGVEMALWDIIGKACSQPIYRLLGGVVHDRIPLFAWIQVKAPAAMAAEAAQAVAEGYKVIYFKVGLGKEVDLQTARLIREAIGPAPKLRVDSNGAWSEGEAIQMITALDEYDLDFVEQPVSQYDLDSLARVQAKVRPRIAIDQAVWLSEQMPQAIRLGVGDVLVSDPHKVGGILALKKIAATAAMVGMSFNKHSFPELGIALLAGFQVCATLTNLDDGNQHYLRLLKDDVIEGGVLPVEEGTLRMPTAPGLGVSLDRDRVARYAERYQKQGAFATRSFK